MCLSVLTKILISILNVLDQKKNRTNIYETTTDVKKQKKKLIRTERTSVIIPLGKDWGQAFYFFKMAAVLCLEC